jgi:tetratricopeptide (TPR) repeat protein
MEEVLAQAAASGDAALEGRALTALAAVSLGRDGDVDVAVQLARSALDTLPADDFEARSDALGRLAAAAWWRSDLRSAETYTREALGLADQAGRIDLREQALATLQWLLALRLDLGGAEEVLAAREPATDGVLTRARAALALGSLRRIQGRLAEAVRAFEEARALHTDAGSSSEAAWCGLLLGWIALVEGRIEEAEHEFRESSRVFTTLEDHGRLCEAQRALAEALLAEGRIEEADRFASNARSLVGPHDLTSQASTTTTLGLVRAAQGADGEAEQLLRAGLALYEGTEHRLLEAQALVSLAQFLRSRGRADEAAELEARLPDPVPGWLGTADARTAATV